MSTEAATLPASRDTIEIEGRMKAGDGHYAVRLRLSVQEEDLTNPEFAATLPALLANLGVEPIVAAAPAPPARATGAPAGDASGAGCPVHGMEYARPGFRGKGHECGAFAPTKQDWTQDRVFVTKSNESRYYCKHKW